MSARSLGEAVIFPALFWLAAGSLSAQIVPFDCTRLAPDGQAVCIYQTFPQIAVGGGFSGEIVLANQGPSDDSSLRVDLFDNGGQRLEARLDGQMRSEILLELKAGESRTLTLDLDSREPVPGYARITHSARASIRGTLILRVLDPDTDELQTQLGVPSVIPLNNWTIPVEVDSEHGINTGLALANGSFRLLASPDPSAQGFVVNLISEEGRVVGRRVIDLPRNGHISGFIDDPLLFPGVDDFRGTLSVSAGIDFGLVALRLERGILSTVAVSEGPMFSALEFTIKAVIVFESEPNDEVATAQAHAIPPSRRVLGEIDPAGDTDLYTFEGSQGDILTAYTISDPAASSLDAFLALQRPDGTLLAVNGLNRLLRRRDAFMQVVLPEDGTFVLRVEDFARQGGPSFTYDLLMRLETPE